MTNQIGKVSDFIIKVVMIFTTIVALVYFAGKFTSSALIFSFLAVLYVLAIIAKGISDIFSKE